MRFQSLRILEQAEALFNSRPSWTRFYREILGPEGIAAAGLTADELAQFEESEAYEKIQAMLTALRAADASVESPPREPIRVITVRLPQPLHESLKAEAHRHATSMNQLCISKLLAPLLAALKLQEQPQREEAAP